MKKINDNIFYNPIRIRHSKASEAYVEVKFIYEDEVLETWIPVEYRRTGLDLKDDEVAEYLESIYPILNPNNSEQWKLEQEEYWKKEKPNAGVTKGVFDAITTGAWECVNCTISNPNWARRFQDLKEMGYTFATQTPVNCPVCEQRSTYVRIVMLPRYHSNIGYEIISPKLRKKIISALNSLDVYENKPSNNLLPDHKFPEIRWDEDTKEVNVDDMSDDEIKNKFQLMTNQRNLQKREVCRKCYQTNKRGTAFGIDFFYQGDENWDENIPKTGKDAEAGCVGCPWYDMGKWREELNKKIKNGD